MMQNNKVGKIILTLRQEQGLTQKQLADKLNVSNKTISKWERGLGLPDISIVPELSNLLSVDIYNLLTGDVSASDFVVGNMKNAQFFVCPTCHNISLCTGNAEVSCCGKKLSVQALKKAKESDKLDVQDMKTDWFITSNHPMTKENYISFVAFVTGDRIQIVKQYPEWNLNVHMPKSGHGMLIWFSTENGLLYQLL
ncbi:MAG: transcriptional regulator, family [Herbinix sp.]|jgi:DNA-binding XRE family transcriptional regulator|nr:transcriptional regulator, family [Herbinix sp.]